MSEHQGFNLLDYAKEHGQELTRSLEVRPGAEVDVKFIGVKAWRKLRKQLDRMKGNDIMRDEAADAKSRAKLAEAVTGWRGMTPEVVADLMPVDPSGLPPELPFNPGNVKALLLNSGEFFQLINSATDDLGSFRDAERESAEKN